ncbi:MAG: sulfopyruvate decarboxylase [Deltaproteobacteria bacterium]|nr:sulfopyruvate decarboxylase [Deltaproteobacteria bacterium]
MDRQAGPRAILEGLKAAGITLIATLPDENLTELLKLVEADRESIHVPLCREEEGIGICAGATLVGKKTAIIMQNGGFLNSCNALTTTALQFQIPLLLLIYYAGDIGDRGFATVGTVTEPVLHALGIRTYLLRRMEEIKETVHQAQVLAWDANRPVALLLTKDVLGTRG